MRLVQAYLGYALHLDKIKTNPASHLKFTYPNEHVERMVFTQAEIKELYQAAEDEQEEQYSALPTVVGSVWQSSRS